MSMLNYDKDSEQTIFLSRDGAKPYARVVHESGYRYSIRPSVIWDHAPKGYYWCVEVLDKLEGGYMDSHGIYRIKRKT